MRPLMTVFLALTLVTASARAQVHVTRDVVLIGGGIMSATLGTLLKELDPQVHITIYERLDQLAAESSDAFNNAGTGHSALCELNYTPELGDGSVEISKAIQTMEAYEVSKQFWASLVQRGRLGRPGDFIHSVPHLAWVHGADNVAFLRKRHAALTAHPLFTGMEYSEDTHVLTRWMPLMIPGRLQSEPMAATRSMLGTDVDFGALTRALFADLAQKPGVEIHLSHEVRAITRGAQGQWRLKLRDLARSKSRTVEAGFVFIGAGGGSLPLLQASGIPESKGFGGFPISGQFLIAKDPRLVKLQNAKVYGRAAVGAPPMSVPHLDTRVIDGKQTLIFGPFAGVTTKFLKHGSSLDLLRSLRVDNSSVMMKAGVQNLPLVGYLMDQASQGAQERMDVLREFIPDARVDDWELITAGQRVQILKQDLEHPTGGGVLRFGTEVVTAEDGSLAALLGASPGASTSVSVMLSVLERSFGAQMKSSDWLTKLRSLIPSYGQSLSADPKLALRLRKSSQAQLGLDLGCAELLERRA